MEAMRLIWGEGTEQLLYGGAAGGAKSHFLRVLAYTLALKWPGARIPIFRLTYPELAKTQVRPWLLAMDGLGYDNSKSWHATDKEYHFANGSLVEFLHIDQSLGAMKWLSTEWAALLVDEAVLFDPTHLRLLASRVRRPLEGQSRLWRDWRPLVVYATNPGGKAHKHLKETFIDPANALTGSGSVWEDEIQIRPGVTSTIRRSFLQSKLADNPSIDPNEYEKQLADLPEQERKRLMDGDWEYFEGKTFPFLSPEVHYVEREWFCDQMPPLDWPRMAGFDLGNNSPSACEWVTRDDDGTFIVYDEYYSEAVNTTNLVHIEAIWSHAQRDGVSPPDLRIFGDPRMKRKQHSRGDLLYSAAEEFKWGGLYDDGFHDERGIRLDFSNLDRITGRMVLQRLLEPRPNRLFPTWHPFAGEYGSPQMFICRQAPNLWREINGIRYKDGGGEDTVKLDDHGYDALWHVMPSFERSLAAPRSRTSPVAILKAVHN